MIEYFDNGDVAVFDGYTFRRDKKTGYFLSAKKSEMVTDAGCMFMCGRK